MKKTLKWAKKESRERKPSFAATRTLSSPNTSPLALQVEGKRAVAVTKNHLPVCTRDINNAIEYMNKYHPKFDSIVLMNPISESIADQVKLFVSMSKRGESLNFSFFDKYPMAVIHFIAEYLDSLEQRIIDLNQVPACFVALSEVNPLDRVKKIQILNKKNPNRVLLKDLLLFLNKLIDRSTSRSKSMDCVATLFCNSLFKVSEVSRQTTREQKRCTKFILDKAKIVFSDDIFNETIPISKEEASGIKSVQTASRKLGTDGMLHLMEEELARMDVAISALNYSDLSNDFETFDKLLGSVDRQTDTWCAQQNSFEAKFSAQYKEVSLLVQKSALSYNNLDFQGSPSDEEFDFDTPEHQY